MEGDQKLENVLRLALETRLEERLQTEDLNIGFDETKKTWELIVKYHGKLDGLRQAGIAVEERRIRYFDCTGESCGGDYRFFRNRICGKA